MVDIRCWVLVHDVCSVDSLISLYDSGSESGELDCLGFGAMLYLVDGGGVDGGGWYGVVWCVAVWCEG